MKSLFTTGSERSKDESEEKEVIENECSYMELVIKMTKAAVDKKNTHQKSKQNKKENIRGKREREKTKNKKNEEQKPGEMTHNVT